MQARTKSKVRKIKNEYFEVVKTPSKISFQANIQSLLIVQTWELAAIKGFETRIKTSC